MYKTRQWICLIVLLVLMSTNCMAFNVLNQVGLHHRLQNSMNGTVGADIVADCVGSGVFARRVVIFYSRDGCANGCPYYYEGSGAYSGNHFAVFDSTGVFTASCGGIKCGQIVAFANDNYYRLDNFVNANDCVVSCNAVCGR